MVNRRTIAARHYSKSVDADGDLQRTVGLPETAPEKTAAFSAAAHPGIDAQGDATELAKPSNIRELHGSTRTGVAIQSRILGDTGFELSPQYLIGPQVFHGETRHTTRGRY